MYIQHEFSTQWQHIGALQLMHSATNFLKCYQGCDLDVIVFQSHVIILAINVVQREKTVSCPIS